MEAKVKNKAKAECIEILVEINRLLSGHLQVQNSLFNPPIKSKIPLIGKKPDFEKLYEMNKEIEAAIFGLIRRLQKVKAGGNGDPFIYNGIKDYALLFHTSSGKLSQIAGELNCKAKKQGKLSDVEYSRLVQEYKLIENTRLQKGTTIQKIASMLAE